MSLIFEALKKLDREKQAPTERGFVVVAQAPWPESRRRRLRWLVLAASLVVVLALGSLVWLRRPRPAAPASPASATAAIPTAVAVARASPIVTPAQPARSTPVPAPAAIWQRPAPSAPPQKPAAAATPIPAAPTPAPRANPPAREELQLQAISERDGQPVAMVSGRLVREGDSFDGVRILKIGPTEVEIETEGRRRILRF